MLIAITSEGLGKDSLIPKNFRKAPCIVFYDVEKKYYQSFKNPFSNLFGGSGIQTCQFIIEKNTNVLIADGIEPSILRLLDSADIKVYCGNNKKIKEAVNEYLENKLEENKNFEKSVIE